MSGTQDDQEERLSGCSFVSSDAFHRGESDEARHEFPAMTTPVPHHSSEWSRLLQQHRGDPLQDTLLRMEAQLNTLSSQMTDALAGIRVLYKGGQEHKEHKGSTRGFELRPRSLHAGGGDGLHDRQPMQQPMQPRGDCDMSQWGSGDHLSFSSFAELPRSYPFNRGSLMSARGSLMSASPDRRNRTSSSSSLQHQVWNSTVITPRRSANDSPVFGPSRSRVSISLPAGELTVDEESTVTSARAANWMQKHTRKRGRFALSVWNFIDNPESGTGAYVYHRLNPMLILLSVITSLVHQASREPEYAETFMAIEMAIEGIFALEILARYLVCPNHWFFFIHTYNIIDMISIIPLVFRILQQTRTSNGEEDHFMYSLVMGFVPAIRLLKTLRRFEQMHLLLRAFQMAAEALPVMLFVFMVVWLFFTGLIKTVEEPSDIRTIGQAMWLVFCSMTSTTFGDLVPRTVAGQILTSVLVTTSTLYMAIPIGIIGKCFSQVWIDRDKILLVERMRQVFRVNGFAPPDIPVLFSHFDPDGNGILSVDEFVDMATALRLGLSEDRLLTLFQIFDGDGSGGVDDKEFCKIVFPEAFYYIFRRTTQGYSRGRSSETDDGGQSVGTARGWLPSFML